MRVFVYGVEIEQLERNRQEYRAYTPPEEYVQRWDFGPWQFYVNGQEVNRAWFERIARAVAEAFRPTP